MTLIIDKNIDRLNQGKFVELTEILIELPKNVSILDELNLFEDVYLSQRKFEIQRQSYGNHLVKDKNYEARGDTLVAKQNRGFLQLSVPNFGLIDAIKPTDVEGVATYNSIQEAAQLESVMDVRIQKLATMNNALDATEALAKMQLLTKGTVYAPSGTLATTYGDTVDWYQEMGVTRQTIDLELSGAKDPRISCSKLIRAMREALRNTPSAGNYGMLLILCGTDYFDEVYTNPFVTDAVKYFQQDLNKLLLGTPSTAPGYGPNFRTITAWGVTFIDAGTGGYTSPNDVFVPWIEADKAIALPTGVRGMFKTYYGPNMTFSTVNKKSTGRSYFERLNDEDDLIQMKVEQNFMGVLLYPQAIFDLTKS